MVNCSTQGAVVHLWGSDMDGEVLSDLNTREALQIEAKVAPPGREAVYQKIEGLYQGVSLVSRHRIFKSS